MKRHLLIGGLIVALLAAAWFVMAGEGGRVRGGARGDSVTEAPSADKAFEPSATSAPATAPLAEARVDEPALAVTREVRRTASEEALARGIWVEGSVVFPPGTPADERVFVEARGKKPEDGEWHEVEVAPDGQFRVAFGAGTKTGRLALRGRYLYLDEAVRWKAAEPGPITLQPLLGACIEGRVVFPAGETADKDDEVQLEITDKTSTGSESDNTSKKLAAEGRFEFGGVRKADVYRLVFDGARCFGHSSEFKLEPGQLARPELVLERGVVLSGRVNDEAGAPVSNANLNVGLEAWGDANSHQWIQTGADGVFRMKALRPGKISMSVSADGFTGLQRELGKLGAGEDQELTLVMERGGSIAGRLQWPDGTPAVGFISAEGRNGFDVFGGDGQKTAEDGSFTITGFEAETVTVRARATRTEEITVKSELTGKERTKKQKTLWNAVSEDAAVGTQDLVLVLSPGLELVGTVVEAGVGPVGAFSLTAVPRGDGPGRFDFSRQVFKAFKDAGGGFTLTGLVPGKWQVTASSKEHVDSEPLEVEIPTDAPVTFVLQRGARVAGVVVDAAGAPVAGATIAVQASRQHDISWRFDDTDDEPRSGADGRFLLPKAKPGVVTLVATAPDFAPSAPVVLEVFAGRETSGVVLTLQSGGTITGEVVGLDGRPAIGVHLWAYERSGGVNFHQNAESDADGRFELTGVPAGNYHLQTELENGLELSAEVELAAGASTHVRLAPESKNVVRLFGRVTLGGDPVEGMNVNAHNQEGRSGANAETDADGEYELTLPGGGRYSISLHRWDPEDRSSRNWSLALDVPESGQLRQDFAIAEARIRGRVTSNAGDPLADVRVVASGARDESALALRYANTQTKADGTYELAVGPGTLRVSAGGSRGGPASHAWAEVGRNDLVLAPGQELSGIDFVLPRGGRLTGRVRHPDGSLAGEVGIVNAVTDDWLGSSNDDGTFEFSGLPGGTFELEARSNRQVSARPVTVTIVPGETATVELELVPAVLVRVALPGVPADAEPTTTLRDAAGRTRELWFREGTLHSSPLPRGTYTLTAEHAGKRAERTFELGGDEGELEFELVLE